MLLAAVCPAGEFRFFYVSTSSLVTNCGAYFTCRPVGNDLMFLCPPGTSGDGSRQSCEPDPTCNQGKYIMACMMYTISQLK